LQHIAAKESSGLSMRKNWWSLAAALVSASCSIDPDPLSGPSEISVVTRAAVGGGLFGLYATDYYQNNWDNNFCDSSGCYGWATTNGFGNRFDDFNTKLFSWGLGGTKSYLEDTNDHLTSDAVDVLWLFTHGEALDAANSLWRMWDSQQNAVSTSMRLGDEARGLKIFASFACGVMKYSDGMFWARLGSIFRGGLKYMVGSHDLIYWGWTMDESGRDFAANLHGSQGIHNAWKNAMSDWWHANDVTAAATGTSIQDCWNRHHSYDHYLSNTFPVLRDGMITHYCYYSWDNL
jgi:hypothetical protein